MKYLYTLLALVCFSCSPKVAENSTELIPIEVSLSDSLNSFEDYYDSVQMINLDNTIPLSGISNIQRTKDAFYVLDSRRVMVIKYDLDGKYIAHIKKIGRSRDEYLSIFSMRVDTVSQMLILTDNSAQKIFIYDLDLNHIKTIVTDLYVGEIAAIRDGKFLHGQVSESDRGGADSSIANGSILVLDSLGNIVEGFYPFPSEVQTPIPMRSISSDGVNFVALPALSHNIYEINETLNKVVPVYSLDFNVKSWTLLDNVSYLKARKEENTAVINTLYKLENKESITFTWGYIVSSDAYLLIRFGNFNPLICIYDRVRDVSKSYFTNTLAQSNALALVLAFPYTSYDNIFYTAMDVGTMKSIARVENMPDTWKERIAMLDDEQNPVVFSYKVK